MYQYSADRKEDALQHALDADGGFIGCGTSVLCFDTIYGWVTEHAQGKLIARWAPTINYATMQATSWRNIQLNIQRSGTQDA